MSSQNTVALPLKLLFVSNSCWSIYNFRLEVIEHFINKGYDVHIAAAKDDFAVKLINIGCKIHNIYFNNRRLNPLQDIQLFFSLKRIYRTVKPNLIFHYVIKPNIYGSIAASQLNIPSVAVITGLGYALSKENLLYKFVIKLYTYALKKIQFVWVLNEEDKKFLIQKKIVPPKKIFLINSEGVNTDRFKPVLKQKEDTGFVFLMATRILWSKGVGEFAEASALLRKKGYNFQCRILGFFEPNHPDTIPLQYIEKWREKKIFDYLGFHQDIIPYLAEADCFVLPSYYQEGVPRSLLEACAMQIPVITTNNNGCKEVVINNVNGFLCDKKNATDLSDKMEQMLLLHEEKLKQMGLNGRKIVLENFDVKCIIKKYDEIISKLFSKRQNIL